MNKAATYQRMYEPGDWFDAQEANNIISWYPEAGTLMDVYRTAGSVTVAETAELLPVKIERIFEFGSGSGAGLVSLDMFALSQPVTATVIGSERTSSGRKDCLKVAEILETVAQVAGDGIDELQRQKESFNLVVANWFGPSYDGTERVEAFVPPAVEALEADGAVIINSDPETMKNVVAWTTANVSQDKLTVLSTQDLPSGFISTPHVIIRK